MERGKKGWAWAFTPIWLLIILALLMACLRLTINSREYFLKAYQRMDIEERIGIPADQSADAIMAMIDYMEGRRESVQLEVREYGQSVAMFNRQEIDHMKDVRALYRAFCRLEYAGLAAFVALCASMALEKGRKAALFRAALGGWWRAMAVFGCLLLALGAYACIDFYDFWTRFHYIFFTNDLWLMDYNACRMIRICPLELFSGIIARFTALGLGALALLSAGAALAGRRERKENL